MDTKSKKSLAWVIIGIVVVIVIVAAAGFAAFGFKHFGGEGEFGMMGGRGGREIGGMMKGRAFGGGHMGFGRLSGQITAVSGSNVTVKNSAGDEVSVAVLDTTSIYNQGKIAKASDLKVNNSVSVSGRPNSSGVVQSTAIFIR